MTLSVMCAILDYMKGEIYMSKIKLLVPTDVDSFDEIDFEAPVTV